MFLSEPKPSFTSLTHLIELDLSKNRLTELPQDFGNLNKLVKLDLYGNQLKTLPITFGQLNKLKWLDLKGNPLELALAKWAGDCANTKQCQTCALNCVKFMRSERIRIETEGRLKDEKRRQQIEFEKQMADKKSREREKKKTKNSRRSARKAQERVQNDEDFEHLDDRDNDSDESEDQQKSRSFGKRVFSFVMFLIRSLLLISSVLLFAFIGIAIGLHLQNGHKLETFDDIITASVNALKTVQNRELFINETTLLLKNLVKSLRNWRKTFGIFENKQNVTKI